MSGIIRDYLASLRYHPTVVCICGSTRFREELTKARRDETLAGNIVLSSEVYTKNDPDLERLGTDDALRLKDKLDELHLRKIDLSHEVLFLNVGNYWGESTRREYLYALQAHKVLRFIEPVDASLALPWEAQ